MKMPPFLLVDACGVLVVAGLASVGLRYGLSGADQTAHQVRTLAAAVDDLTYNARRMKNTLEAQRAAYQARSSDFEEGDLLPEKTPVEADLRVISDLARRNHLQLTEFTPLGTTRYPGVCERQYRFKAGGTFAWHVGFLRDFRRSASWADITFVKLLSPDPQTLGDKACELVVSLYSATGEEAGQSEGPRT